MIGDIWAGGAGAAEATGELAMIYHANGMRDEAEQVYRVLMEREPQVARWPYLGSDLLGTAGRLSEAEQWLRRTVELEPKKRLARRKLGDLLLKAGRAKEAGTVYEAVLAQAGEEEADDAYALLGWARVAVEDGRWLDARQRLERLVAGHPTFARGLSLLATVDEVLGETKRAAEMRRRAEEAGRFREERDAALVGLLAYCFNSYGLRVAASASEDRAWAEVLLRRATELDPEEVLNWQQLGQLLREAGRWDEAEEVVERALEVAPRDAQVWQDRVALARERRDLAEVFRVVEAGVASCPDDAGLNYEWGRARVQAGELREAVDPLKRAVALDPYNQTAAVELVALWFRVEEPERAEAEMTAALGRDGDYAPMLEFLVRFHVRGGRREEPRPR
ncbi:MAG: tetratricopeptide repeat protein [Candidatus Synoicihabitans palmerolidicus]|nr:tetratricopeptide repeat protein [Candidatus Synoicihabitans palmerolidicus]